MSTTLEKRLTLLESRGNDGGTCLCVYWPSLDSDNDRATQPALCPHGRPWAIKVIYDDPPRQNDEGPHDA